MVFFPTLLLATSACILHTWGPSIGANAADLRGKVKRSKLDDLNKEFPGVYWDYALQECTSDQVAVLEDATRVSKDYMGNVLAAPPDNANGEGSVNTPAWDLFFVKSDDWLNKEKDQFDSIWHNIKQASKYPYEGYKDPARRSNENRRVAYHCKGFTPNEHKCANSPGL